MALSAKAIQPNGVGGVWTLNHLLSVKIGLVTALSCTVVCSLPVMEQMILGKEK